MSIFEILYSMFFLFVVVSLFHLWFGLKNWWALILVVIGLTLMVGFTESLRFFFGAKYGNIVITALIFAGVAISLIKHFFVISKKREAIASLCVLVSISFAFLAWFIQPNRVLERSANRVEDAKIALNRYITGEKSEVPEENERSEKHYSANVLAAEFEHKATLIRSDMSPAVFNNATSIKVLWLCSVLFLLYGVWPFYKPRKTV